MNNHKQYSAGQNLSWKILVRILALLALLHSASVFSAGSNSHSWRGVYGSFYNGNFYFGIGNSFSVLPNVSGPFYLTVHIIKHTLKSLLLSGGAFSRPFHSASSIKYTHQKMVDCSGHNVNIEDPVFRALLSIQTGCMNDAEPLWVIHASPIWPFTVPGYDAREIKKAPLYKLHQLMHEYRLRFITLQPSRKLNSLTGQATGTVTAYTCDNYGACFALDFNFDTGDQKWLLEELIVRTRNEPWSIPWRKNSSLNISSIFEADVVNQITSGLSCLLEHSEQSEPEQHLSCKENNEIIRQGGFHWRFIPRQPVQLKNNWLYTGKGYRILPLQQCISGGKKHVWQCPGYLVWSQDSHSWSSFGESVPIVTIQKDQELTDYQARYFDYDFYGIGSYHRHVNHADKLLRYLVGLPVSLGPFVLGYAADPGNALVPVEQNAHFLPLMSLARIFHKSATSFGQTVPF